MLCCLLVSLTHNILTIPWPHSMASQHDGRGGQWPLGCQADSRLTLATPRPAQVWRTPGFEKQMSPMQLHRTYGGCHADITRIDWSACGRFLAAASKDLTARVFSLDPIPGYQPATLAGHKEALAAVFFTGGWPGGWGCQRCSGAASLFARLWSMAGRS